MKKVIYLSVILLASACATKKVVNVMEPTEKDVKVAQHRNPNASLADLKEGYTLYASNCGKCHELHRPTDFDLARWDRVLPPMYKKARIEETKDQDLIRMYVYSKIPASASNN